jgi:hypothetical protein
LIILGWFLGRSIILMGIGAILLFSAFYDRCPIYRAVVTRLAARLHHSDGEGV